MRPESARPWAGGSEPASPDRPHVVFVLGGLGMGGAEAQLTSLLEAGRHVWSGWRVTILTLTTRQDPTLVRRLSALGVRLATVDRGAARFPVFFARLYGWLRRARPDLVHTMLGGSTGTWGRFAARLAGVPRIVHSDRSLAPIRTPWQRRLEPLANRLTDRFLTNATAVAERLAVEGVARDRIRVVRNGVDLDRFDAGDGAGFRHAWGVADDAVVAGFLGMLRPEKRPDLLLDAVMRVPEGRRPSLIAIAGDGELMEPLRARVASDPWLRAHVRLLGVVADTPDFLAAIDVLVLTSDTEGLPNAVIEAMAAGVPCIATRVSDVPDLVSDNGFVIDPGDASALASALERVVRLDRSARAELGRNGRARAEADFDLTRAAERFEAQHQQLLRDVAVRGRA